MQETHNGVNSRDWFRTKPRYSHDLRVILVIQHYGYEFNKRHTSSALRSLNTSISAIHRLCFQISSLLLLWFFSQVRSDVENSRLTFNIALTLHLLQVLYKTAN